jgi:hypothetical protein
MSNDLIDPAELMRRGFHLWSSTRWPGRDGRLRYAHTLFNLYLVRQLALLAMRVWDGDSSRASERLAQVQGVLGELWTSSPGDQPVLVRDGHAVYTQLGRRHVELLEEYAARIARVASSLHEDCRHFRPRPGAYSPYGALYGVASNLLEHMALKILDRGADARFGLEDVFTAGTAEKLAWVSGWRKLPHVSREVARLYAYPQEFAERISARVEQALERRVEVASRAARTGRLFVIPGEAAEADANLSSIAALPLRFIGSSDREIVAAQKAYAEDRAQLARDRQEGHFLLSYPTSGG